MIKESAIDKLNKELIKQVSSCSYHRHGDIYCINTPRSMTSRIRRCENLIDRYSGSPKVIETMADGCCCYDYLSKTICMLPMKYIKSDELYYLCFFHELIHSLIHETCIRLLRYLHYANQEEIVAAIGAMHLSYATGILNHDIKTATEAYVYHHATGWDFSLSCLTEQAKERSFYILDRLSLPLLPDFVSIGGCNDQI